MDFGKSMSLAGTLLFKKKSGFINKKVQNVES